jgi:hypothetical protein
MASGWTRWTWVGVALIGAYLTGFTPIVEISERCPEFSSPTPGAEYLCHSHLGPDAKFRRSDAGAPTAIPGDVPATQSHRLAVRLANLQLWLFDLDF